MIIDVSHWHPIKDWNKAEKDAEFLISKATEGVTFIDNTLNSFISNCEKHGIPYWLYCYLKRGGTETDQVKYMMKICEPLIGKHFVGYILDVENNNSAADVEKALKYLESKSEKCGIYTMYAQYNTYKKVIQSRGKNTFFWEARYNSNNGTYKDTCHDDVDMHQFTSNGVCSYASGAIDVNRVREGKKPLSWYLSRTGTADTVPVKSDIPTYHVGKVYKTNVELIVRQFPDVASKIVGYKGLTASAKTSDKDKDGAIDKDTKVTCKGIVVDDDGNIWMHIPSGYICAYLRKKDKIYVN